MIVMCAFSPYNKMVCAHLSYERDRQTDKPIRRYIFYGVLHSHTHTRLQRYAVLFLFLTDMCPSSYDHLVSV